jgi:CheY-like chemotaxis protein
MLGPQIISESPTPVLLVDDDPAFLRITRRLLERTTPPFSVFSVGSGAHALAFLRKVPPFAAAPTPAFVILDLRLPDFNAPTVLRRLSDHKQLRAIPVLVVSQAKWAEDEEEVRIAGAADFCIKPSRIDQLRDVLVGFWENHVRE